ncbi:hypothetical protein L6R52_21580, partial [Myxococcota bacterium]|nr:hypothetical protein [Myxococcota bacterium]
LGRAELAAWTAGAEATATRFGLLVSGDLAASIRALRRNDASTLGEPFDTPAAREAALRRAPLQLDLVRFALSEDYELLLREGATRADTGRF